MNYKIHLPSALLLLDYIVSNTSYTHLNVIRVCTFCSGLSREEKKRNIRGYVNFIFIEKYINKETDS